MQLHKKKRAWLQSDPEHIEKAHKSAKRWRERNRLKLRKEARIRAANLRKLARIGRSVSTGRKRKDDIRARVIELNGEGKSWGQIKTQLDRETGKARSLRTYRGYLEN